MPPTKIEILPGGIPTAHYAAIGQVAANTSALELLVSGAIWALAGIDDDAGVCLTSQIFTLEGRLKALVALARVRGAKESTISQLNTFMADVRSTSDTRNRIIHDPWVAAMPFGQFHRFQATADRRLIFDYVPMDTTEIDTVVNQIADFIDRFVEILQSETDLLAKWRKPLPGS